MLITVILGVVQVMTVTVLMLFGCAFVSLLMTLPLSWIYSKAVSLNHPYEWRFTYDAERRTFDWTLGCWLALFVVLCLLLFAALILA